MTIPYNFTIQGTTGKFSSEINGYFFTRTLILTDVVETPEGDDADIHQAFSALVDDFVPLIGNDLGHISLDLVGCWLREIDVAPLGNNQWRVILQYQHSPFNTVTNNIQVSSGAQVSQVESNKDRDGDSIQLIYLYPDDYKLNPDLQDTFSDAQGGTFPKLVPETTRTFTLREAIDPVTVQWIVGAINDRNWLWVDPNTGGDENDWMCTSITGTTDDSQRSPAEWINQYTFQFKIDGWQPEVVFHDANTNEPVPDPQMQYQSSDAKGLASKVIVDAYRELDFATLFPEFTITEF